LKVTRESIEDFTVEFESDEELRHEFEANLSAGGLFLSSTERPAEMSYYLIKNPRITTEEVLRIARMTSISAAVADQIAKTTQWSSNQEIRSAIVNNLRTPTPLALKLLGTLPEPEIRHIAKSTGVSQALKQAALRIVISRG
jgi:hypothetical protein